MVSHAPFGFVTQEDQRTHCFRTLPLSPHIVLLKTQKLQKKKILQKISSFERASARGLERMDVRSSEGQKKDAWLFEPMKASHLDNLGSVASPVGTPALPLMIWVASGQSLILSDLGFPLYNKLPGPDFKTPLALTFRRL